MSKRVFQPVLTLFLALIVTASLLMGCKATAVTPTSALPTSTAELPSLLYLYPGPVL